MMSEQTGQPAGIVPLSARERRVLGVLIEKQKTTPEYYPMTISALVTGCNQKSNRDPVTSYDADQVEEILEGLRRKGAVILVEGAGRGPKWKHTLYDWLDLKNRPTELAILAELLLRGPQTEGELRGRASRMNEIPDLDALDRLLEFLKQRGLVVQLSPPGQRRGVVVTHGMYPPEELERVRQAHQRAALAAPGDDDDAPAPAASRRAPAHEAELGELRTEIEQVRAELAGLRAEFEALKASLGA
jgi:uncharacterized protein YceH (UPF0502 family)